MCARFKLYVCGLLVIFYIYSSFRIQVSGGIAPVTLIVEAMPPKLKRTCPPLTMSCSSLVESHLGIGGLIKAFNGCREAPGADYVPSWIRKLARGELYRVANTETPFGNMCEPTLLHGEKNPLQAQHLNPLAFFYYTMGKSERWARLLLKRQAEAPDQCLTRCIYLWTKLSRGTIKDLTMVGHLNASTSLS